MSAGAGTNVRYWFRSDTKSRLSKRIELNGLLKKENTAFAYFFSVRFFSSNSNVRRERDATVIDAKIRKPIRGSRN